MSIPLLLRRTSRHNRLIPCITRPLVSLNDDNARCAPISSTDYAPHRRYELHGNRRQLESRRGYHATQPSRILPLIAIGVGVIGVYSYRALQQMDDDWEEYYEKLDEYRRVTGLDPEATSVSGDGATDGSVDASAGTMAKRSGLDEMSSLFTGGTLSIDLGTSRIKLAHLPALNKRPDAKPTVTVDREGARSTPSLIWISNDANEEEFLIGTMAEGRLYDRKGGNVLRPREILQDATSDAEVNKAIQQSIQTAAYNALEQAIGGNSSQSISKSHLFVLDESMAYGGAYNVRPVFTYPPSGDILARYQQSIQNMTSPQGIAMFVSEPIAILTGADYYNLLPPGKDPVLIVDVGGSTTNISVVSNENVAYSFALPFGGDTFVDLLILHLIEGFYGAQKNQNEGISTKPTLDDTSALQRLYEASTTALHELSNKSRSQINIPFLSIDLQTKQPRHLNVGVPRNIVNKEVEMFVRDRLVDYLSDEGKLSSSLPRPTDLSSLFSTALTKAMEETSQTPFSLRALLLVGGGARIPLIRDSIKCAVGQVAGDVFLERLVVPEGEVGDELAVLGAAVWGSTGDKMQ